MTKYYKIDDKDFTQIVLSSFSIRECLRKQNLDPTGGNYKIFYNRVKKLNLDTSHFTGKAHLKNKTHNYNTKPIELLLVENSSITNNNSIKNRLIKLGLLEYKCFECKINTWNNKEIVLHLDHLNGINNDYRLENLRLLCPNCHSQTQTYCGKNKGKHKK